MVLLQLYLSSKYESLRCVSYYMSYKFIICIRYTYSKPSYSLYSQLSLDSFSSTFCFSAPMIPLSSTFLSITLAMLYSFLLSPLFFSSIYSPFPSTSLSFCLFSSFLLLSTYIPLISFPSPSLHYSASPLPFSFSPSSSSSSLSLMKKETQ